MTIKYSVVTNNLLQNKFRANTIRKETLSENDIITEMLKRGTTLNKPDLLAAFSLMTDVIIDKLMDGNRICTNLANFRVDIEGVFNNPNDLFDARFHKIKVNVSPGNGVKEKMDLFKCEKQAAKSHNPVLLQIHDFATKENNASITPGKNARLDGDHIKFNPLASDEGLFFKNTSEQLQKVEEFTSILPKSVGFTIPESLEPGTYRLILRNRFWGKSLKEGELEYNLRVI